MNPAELFRQDSDLIILAPGQSLFREGERGDDMFVLLDGCIDVLAGGKVVDTAQSGALLGEMALIDRSPRSASAVARTDCKLAKIDLRRFHFLVQQTPFFATHVMQVLAQRLRKMNHLVVDPMAFPSLPVPPKASAPRPSASA